MGYSHPLQLIQTTKLIIKFSLISLALLNASVTTTHHRAIGTIGAYKISPKPCKIESRSGTCMFVWECLKSEGKHLGMCVDGFMFGSCCGHNDTANDVEEVYNGGTAMITVKPSEIPTSTQPPAHEIIPTLTVTVGPPDLDLHFEPDASFPFVTSNNSHPDPPPVILPERLPFTTTTTEHPKITTTTEIPSTTRHTTTPVTTTTESSHVFQTQAPPVTTTTRPETKDPENEEDFCGKAPLYPQMRIVGGKQSALGQFPWIASIRRTSFFGFSSTHRCGGALLNSGWVATAGHCVDDLLATQIRVRLGEWDFSGTDDKYPHFESTIVKKVVHPSYNFFTYENDLALLKLEKPVNFSKYIRPICLPGNQDLLIGENGTVAGWGRLTENGQLPSRLQHVTVPIMSNSRCRELFLKSNRVEHIPDIFLCAGYENGGQDSCQGDSGGPLQIKGRDGRYFLGGIISWGIGCAEPNMPGVCTRISKFTDWIMANVT